VTSKVYFAQKRPQENLLLSMPPIVKIYSMIPGTLVLGSMNMEEAL